MSSKNNSQEALTIAPFVRSLPFSADVVWEEIRKMDNLDRLSHQVDSVSWEGPRGVGGERVLQGVGHSFRERITAFDDARRSYAYEVVEGVPARQLSNTVRVIDEGYRRCLVVWTSSCSEFLAGLGPSPDEFTNFLAAARNEIIDNLDDLLR